ncbi:hypothetical protein CNECB9_3430050 [Cupriavidus necator]|uniref:Uncharacterized protein n=1 Tax=Cupriavidus necator TaxID=106590 RepID=A0A1K0IUU1_CUPNE|nr:hypothetical protein CNECB9_3430050 [Cupriavidus necator]
MLGFAKAIAQEHGRDRINVNTIALGAVSHEGIANSPLHPSATPETDDRLKKILGAYPIARGRRHRLTRTGRRIRRCDRTGWKDHRASGRECVHCVRGMMQRVEREWA